MVRSSSTFVVVGAPINLKSIYRFLTNTYVVSNSPLEMRLWIRLDEREHRTSLDHVFIKMMTGHNFLFNNPSLS